MGVYAARPLNARQREVLQWIGDGCPAGVMKDFTHKTTAVALQGRQLVTVSRKGGIWAAVTTAAGDYYLRHGNYPADMRASRQPITISTSAAGTASGPSARVPAPRQEPGKSSPRLPRALTIHEQAEDLVARVIQAGGALELDAEDDDTDYKLLCKAAKKAPNLPFGKQLRTRNIGSWRSNQYEIYFDEDFFVRVPVRPVPVPQRVAAYHPVVAAYRADSDHQEVSRESLGRACRILQALAAEAVQRGHTVKAPKQQKNQYTGAPVRSLKDGQLRLLVNEFTYCLRIREQSVKGGERPDYGPRWQRLPAWQRARQTEFRPTGELRITIDSGYGRDGRQAEFHDTKRASLEDRLPDILHELEVRAAEDNHRRQEAQRQAADKRRRWEQAMEQARHAFRENQLAEVLRAQAANWRLGQGLDEYLLAMETKIAVIASKQAQDAAMEWLNWARGYRQNIDPLMKPLAVPATRKPSPEDLKPFLEGWSPYTPD